MNLNEYHAAFAFHMLVNENRDYIDVFLNAENDAVFWTLFGAYH